MSIDLEEVYQLTSEAKIIFNLRLKNFLDMPNRYELVSLLRTLAHDKGKCILFSTHELEVALRMCDRIALVDNGALHHLSVTEMMKSGLIQRLFSYPNLNLEEYYGRKRNEIYISGTGFYSYHLHRGIYT